jgi:hypothetical protein
MMWKLLLFAETEEAHEKAWRVLCKESDNKESSYAISMRPICLLGPSGHAASSASIATLVSASPPEQRQATTMSRAIS